MNSYHHYPPPPLYGNCRHGWPDLNCSTSIITWICLYPKCKRGIYNLTTYGNAIASSSNLADVILGSGRELIWFVFLMGKSGR